MAATTPRSPDLQANRSPNTTSFKRTFDQVGPDGERQSASEERTKRARSEGDSTGDEGRGSASSSPATSSSSAISSSSTSSTNDSNPAHQYDFAFAAASPVGAAALPTSPLPTHEDARPYIRLPPPPPRAHGHPSDQLRVSFDRFASFDSNVSRNDTPPSEASVSTDTILPSLSSVVGSHSPFDRSLDQQSSMASAYSRESSAPTRTFAPSSMHSFPLPSHSNVWEAASRNRDRNSGSQTDSTFQAGSDFSSSSSTSFDQDMTMSDTPWRSAIRRPNDQHDSFADRRRIADQHAASFRQARERLRLSEHLRPSVLDQPSLSSTVDSGASPGPAASQNPWSLLGRSVSPESAAMRTSDNLSFRAFPRSNSLRANAGAENLDQFLDNIYSLSRQAAASTVPRVPSRLSHTVVDVTNSDTDASRSRRAEHLDRISILLDSDRDREAAAGPFHSSISPPLHSDSEDRSAGVHIYPRGYRPGPSLSNSLMSENASELRRIATREQIHSASRQNARLGLDGISRHSSPTMQVPHGERARGPDITTPYPSSRRSSNVIHHTDETSISDRHARSPEPLYNYTPRGRPRPNGRDLSREELMERMVERYRDELELLSGSRPDVESVRTRLQGYMPTHRPENASSLSGHYLLLPDRDEQSSLRAPRLPVTLRRSTSTAGSFNDARSAYHSPVESDLDVLRRRRASHLNYVRRRRDESLPALLDDSAELELGLDQDMDVDIPYTRLSPFPVLPRLNEHIDDPLPRSPLPNLSEVDDWFEEEFAMPPSHRPFAVSPSPDDRTRVEPERSFRLPSPERVVEPPSASGIIGLNEFREGPFRAALERSEMHRRRSAIRRLDSQVNEASASSRSSLRRHAPLAEEPVEAPRPPYRIPTSDGRPTWEGRAFRPRPPELAETDIPHPAARPAALDDVPVAPPRRSSAWQVRQHTELGTLSPVFWHVPPDRGRGASDPAAGFIPGARRASAVGHEREHARNIDLHNAMTRRARLAASRLDPGEGQRSETAVPGLRSESIEDNEARQQSLIERYRRERSAERRRLTDSLWGEIDELTEPDRVDGVPPTQWRRAPRPGSPSALGNLSARVLPPLRSELFPDTRRNEPGTSADSSRRAGIPGIPRRDRRMEYRRDYLAFRSRALGDYMRDEDLDTSDEGLLRLTGLLGEARPRGTPDNVVETLPSATYKDWATPGETERCPICLDDYEEADPVLKISGCSHWFHKSCLVLWLKGARTCPVCRGRVGPQTRREPPSGAGPSITRLRQTHEAAQTMLDNDLAHQLLLQTQTEMATRVRDLLMQQTGELSRGEQSQAIAGQLRSESAQLRGVHTQWVRNHLNSGEERPLSHDRREEQQADDEDDDDDSADSTVEDSDSTGGLGSRSPWGRTPPWRG